MLAVSNFPAGATVLSQEDGPLPYLPHAQYSSAFTRSFGAVSADGTHMASLVSSAVDYDQASVATGFMSSLIIAVSSKAGRALVAAAIRNELATVTSSSKVAIRSTRAPAPRACSTSPGR